MYGPFWTMTSTSAHCYNNNTTHNYNTAAAVLYCFIKEVHYNSLA